MHVNKQLHLGIYINNFSKKGAVNAAVIQL